MKRSAIAADIFADPVRLNQRHNKGINVAYADGSAEWVDRKTLTNDLPPTVNQWGDPTKPMAIPAPFETLSDSFGTTISGNTVDCNLVMEAVWQMLDNRGK